MGAAFRRALEVLVLLLFVASLARATGPAESLAILGVDGVDRSLLEDRVATPTTTASPAVPTLILAGGGPEGELTDTGSWSAKLYRHCLDGGDVTGDGKVTVAVVARNEQTEFIPKYFKQLGANDAYNVIVPTRAAADDAGVLRAIAQADAIFIKGGNQGVYYDLWHGTSLEKAIRHLARDLHGAIGGTSAGAMAQAQFTLAGGKSLKSVHVLQDARTDYLDDEDGGLGVHDDFLGLLAGTCVDTHFTERGRLGRLLGAMAAVATDLGHPEVLGIGVGTRTGLWIRGRTASVIGCGSVTFLRQTPDTTVVRQTGKPLIYTHLATDVLTDGWSFDLDARVASPGSSRAEPVHSRATGAPNAGSISISGDAGAAAFAMRPRLPPRGYALDLGTAPFIQDAIGITDGQADGRAGPAEVTIFRALYDRPGTTGFILGAGSRVERHAFEPDVLSFGADRLTVPEVAAIVVDSSPIAYRGLSPEASNLDPGDGSLHSAALSPLVVHVLSQTAGTGFAYDSRRHRVLVARSLMHPRTSRPTNSVAGLGKTH